MFSHESRRLFDLARICRESVEEDSIETFLLETFSGDSFQSWDFKSNAVANNGMREDSNSTVGRRA